MDIKTTALYNTSLEIMGVNAGLDRVYSTLGMLIETIENDTCIGVSIPIKNIGEWLNVLSLIRDRLHDEKSNNHDIETVINQALEDKEA